MSKRSKQQAKTAVTRAAASNPVAGEAKPSLRERHAPAKRPTLLAVSMILFALWFVFLLVTALTG